MLPTLHYRRYQEFQKALEQTHTIAAQIGFDSAKLKLQVSELQQFFQDQILSLHGDDLAPEIEQRVRSYQVEMNKQLRLLGMDVMFLLAARQSATHEQRRNQLDDRLTTLHRYCEAVLAKE